MAIPKYDEIQFEALKLLSDGVPRKAKEFIERKRTINHYSNPV